MVQTKEEYAIKAKARREANKEKLAIKAKARYEKNKEEIAIKTKVYREKNKEAIAISKKIYSKTPAGKQTRIIATWKHLGAIGDLKLFYNERYLPATKCEVCENEFKSSHHKCMDHCHETGEIRWVLCHSCNNYDHWKKKVARKEEATIS